MPEAPTTTMAAVRPPIAALEGLGIVDLTEPGPSASAAGSSRIGTILEHGTTSSGLDTSTAAASSTPTTNTTSNPHHALPSHTDLSADALGLPPDAQIIRVPEGERYRVRAVYDFEATDESALSFRAGDVIEVLTMLPSGWWDGMLGTSRGWFPSNYVEDADDDLYDDDYVEMAHDGRVVNRNGSAADMLSVGEGLGLGSSNSSAWNHWGGDSTTSLDELALELMGGGGSHPDDESTSLARTDRRRRATSGSSREDPDRTVLALPSPPRGAAGAPGAGHTDAWVPSLTGDGRVYYHNTQTGEDAWDIPEGESEAGDTISLAESRASQRQTELEHQHQSQQFHSSQRSQSSIDARRLSYDRARERETANTQRRLEQRDVPPRGSSSRPTSMLRSDDPFRVPPNRATGGVPYPWVARLTDDGRGYIYINQMTGETRPDAPPTSYDGMQGVATAPPRRSSLTSSTGLAMAPVTSRPAATVTASHPSSSAQRDSTAEWEQRISGAVGTMYMESVAPSPSIYSLVDKVNEAVRDVYDAAVAGAAAENEFAEALESHSGIAAASQADDSAVSSMISAYNAVLVAVRDLFVALGYVGPAIPPMLGIDSSVPDEQRRPHWASDVSVLGALGALWMTTHAAATGLRAPDSAESQWDRVMRAATKLRALLDSFPALALPDMTTAERDVATGRKLVAWFGADSLGEFLSGKFGFAGSSETVLRPLDQAAVVEVQRLKTEVDAALRAFSAHPGGSVLEILRSSTQFRDAIANIDIAVMIDLDGEQGTSEALPEDAKVYAELVGRARQALRDLDESCLALDCAAADLFLRSDDSSNSVQTLEAFSYTVTSMSRALSTVLVVAQEQAATVEQGVVRGSVGFRSPSKRKQAAHIRSNQSVGSLESIATHATRPSADLGRVQALHTRDASIASSSSQRTRATGSEQEYVLDSDEQRRQQSDKRSSHRLSRTSQSGSASQTSLAKPGGASSSNTSLVQETSEAGSLRGSNRSSILKAVPSFLRNRSGSEAERAKSRKKLHKPPPIQSQLTPSPKRTSMHGPPVAPPASAHGPQPEWYNEADYDPAEIVLDDRGAVKAGTIRALIARLTAHTSADTGFFQAFLLTYRSFVGTDELVTLLIERFNIEPPEDLDEEQLAEWKLRKQRPIQLRVANVLKAWLEHHFMEDKDQDALNMVDNFANSLPVDGNGGVGLMAKQFMQLVERRRRGDSMLKNRVITGGLPPPSPIPTRGTGGKALSLLDINPLELARQLTIIETATFTAIKPVECLNKAFQVNRKVNAPHIAATIDTANALAGMIQTQILSHPDPKHRAAIVKHLIRTATECHDLNNFSSMAALVAGLSASPIRRLKKTWAELGDKPKQQLANLEGTMDPSRNFAKYHELLKTINPPCVPYIGFYLSALVFIEDGNKDMVPNPSENGRRQSLASQSLGSPSPMMSSSISSSSTAVSTNSSATDTTASAPPTLINFFKRSLTADTLRDIQQYQSSPYNLQTYKPVQDWVKRAIEMPYPPADDLWALSLALEPKEQNASDDRHTKLLQALGGYVPGA